MKITNETELSVYKVLGLDDFERYIVAVDFKDLQQDLIDGDMPPKKIELLDFEVYATKTVLGTK